MTDDTNPATNDNNLITFDSATPATVSAPLAITGLVAPTTQTVSFLAGATSASVTVPITEDTAGEPAETVILTLTNATGTTLGTQRQRPLPSPTMMAEWSQGRAHCSSAALR